MLILHPALTGTLLKSKIFFLSEQGFKAWNSQTRTAALKDECCSVGLTVYCTCSCSTALVL